MSTALETKPGKVETAVEKRNKELAGSAWSMLQEMKPAIAAVLPRHLTPERMAMIAFTAMRRTPRLMLCTKESIIGSIMTASMLGLEPSGPLGHGALIPYGTECQFQPMYQGLLDLARRSGFVKDVQLRAVYKGDHYLYRFGLDPTIEHVPMEGPGADDPNREATHVYAIIRLNGGGVQWDQMSYAQGLAWGKRYSPSFNTRDYPNVFKPGSVWADNPLAMILKTILKITLKLCPKSPELAAAIQMDDLGELGKIATMTKVAEGVFDIDLAEPEPDPQNLTTQQPQTSAIDRIVAQKQAETKPEPPAESATPPVPAPVPGGEPQREALSETEAVITEDQYTVISATAQELNVKLIDVQAFMKSALGYKKGLIHTLKQKDYVAVMTFLNPGTGQ